MAKRTKKQAEPPDLWEQIKKLASLNVELDAKGGPEHAGRLFEKVLTLEDAILGRFGLPSTPFYTALLEFDHVPWDNEIDELEKMLEKQAESHKRSLRGERDKFLKDAGASGRDASFVLPELGISHHIYTEWLYGRFRANKITAEDFFYETDLLASDESGSLNDIGTAAMTIYQPEKMQPVIEELEKRGLRFAREYLEEHIREFAKLWR